MERLTEKRDGQNVIPLRQDGKHKWSLASAGMGDASTQFLYGAYADKLAEYEDSEEQGLLFRFPVPIGTTVYKFEPFAKETKRYIKTTVTRYDIFDNSIWFTFANGFARNIEDFGKYVFLTQEEAEQKLKEMESGEDNEE